MSVNKTRRSKILQSELLIYFATVYSHWDPMTDKSNFLVPNFNLIFGALGQGLWLECYFGFRLGIFHHVMQHRVTPRAPEDKKFTPKVAWLDSHVHWSVFKGRNGLTHHQYRLTCLRSKQTPFLALGLVLLLNTKTFTNQSLNKCLSWCLHVKLKLIGGWSKNFFNLK